MSKFYQFLSNQFRKNEIALHELRYLFWECTQNCNLQCLHCGSECTTDRKTEDMPFDVFLNAILPLKKQYKSDTITIGITGGEPLLRKDLIRCGLTLRKNGFRWGIVTNGYNYTAEVHKQLLAAGMGSITISLDGLEPTHNWLRANDQSFERAVNAIKLIAPSARLFYDVVTCINQRNLYELEEFREFLISLGVKTWRMFTIWPIGRAVHNEDLHLKPHQLKQLMEFIAKARNDKRINTTFSCEAFVGEYERRVRDTYFFCRAGIQIASILKDGSIAACPNINRNFIEGNIYRDNLLDVWNNKYQIMRDRKWCKIGICKNCSAFKNCNGGPMHQWNEKKDGIMVCHHRQILNI